MLSKNKKVTVTTTNALCKGNQKKNHSRKEEQGLQSYWSTHERNFFPAEMPPPGKHQNNMCLSGLAVHHPAYKMLLKYATGGCPVKTGLNWTKEEINAAVMRRPHESALADDAIAHFSTEAKVKVASKWAGLVLYDDIKGKTPQK